MAKARQVSHANDEQDAFVLWLGNPLAVCKDSHIPVGQPIAPQQTANPRQTHVPTDAALCAPTGRKFVGRNSNFDFNIY